MAETPEAQLASLAADLRHVQRDTTQQSKILDDIKREVGVAARKSDRLDARLTELEEHSRETMDGVRELRDMAGKRGSIEETQLAAAQLVFKWGSWASAGLLVLFSLWSGKAQAVLESVVRLFGQRP